MRSAFLFIGLIYFLKLEAQFELSLSNVSPYRGNGIKNSSEWTTGVLTSVNVFASYINIKNFRKTQKKSNAGFFLFPGLVQLGIGTFYKEQDDPTRNIDIAVGASSALICIGRMVYKPKNKIIKTAMITPYCLPSKKGWLSGLLFRSEF